METTKTLVLVFRDENNTEKSLSIREPKENLGLEEVMDVMADIIDAETFMTSSGNLLATAVKAYYRTVTTIPLETTDGE